MTEAYKLCPICAGRNQRHAALCATCGTSLADVEARDLGGENAGAEERYDVRLGEADLAESALTFRARLWGGLALLAIVALSAIVAVVVWRSSAPGPSVSFQDPVTATKPTRHAGPTVTPGTPTATFTASATPSPLPSPSPTAAPCVQRVTAGDSLIGIIGRCGYRSLEIMPTVMALNGIADETRLQIGQEIVMPRPSATPDPAATAPPSPDPAAGSADAGADDLLRLAFDPLAPTLTPTLLPGLMWHVVQPNDDLILISLLYDTDAKALSDINPELAFPLCDFSARFGGPECTVVLRIGQLLRVPAPPATITPIPTPSGSETPTPEPTATFNAPLAQSPPDRAFFTRQEQITLRWVGTGRLAREEVYRVAVTDLDAERVYSAETRELFFIVPAAWGARSADSHEFAWQVSVVDASSGQIQRQTATRHFLWQGAGEAAP